MRAPSCSSVRRSVVALSLVPLVLLTACGGGGDSPSYAGTYDLSLTKASDNCGTGSPNAITLQQKVTQSGRTIRLVSEDLTLEGEIESDNSGFTVTHEETDSGVVLRAAVVYLGAPGASDYSVGLGMAAKAGSAVCMVTYGGNAKRV